MKRLLIIAATALFAAACQPMPSDQPAAAAPTAAQEAQTPAQQASTTETAASCEARGGKLMPVGRLQSTQCVVSYADAGKRCTDGDDCQGACIADETASPPQAGAAVTGRCQASSNRFGCSTSVESGRAEPTLCID